MTIDNKFVKDYPITNSLMDADFRLSPIGASMLFQDCFAIYMSRHHVAAFDIRPLNRMWIINDFSMRFIGEQPFWGTTVQVELWVSEEPKVKVHVDYRIKLNGITVVEGDCSWAVLDTESRHPIAAKDVLPQFDIIPELVFDTHRHKLPTTKALFEVYKHITNSSDTDFNHHISNVTDLRVCFDAMPSEYTRSHTVSEFSIKFLHEAFLGQELTCSIYSTGTPNLWCYNITNNTGDVISQAMVRYV